MIRRAAGMCVFLAAISGCAGAAPPDPGRGNLAGTVRLIPRSGVHATSASLSYGDRRYRDAQLVDYSSPGLTVVYLEDTAPPEETVRLSIGRSRLGILRFEPAVTAVGARGRIQITNSDATAHTLSCPELQAMELLAPGKSTELLIQDAGPHGLFLLDASGIEGTVFAAPGLFAVASPQGRWNLRNVDPGAYTLKAWNPRFPAPKQRVEVREGQVTSVGIDIGVDALRKEQP